ncbi:hypothetical protein [Pseudomonas sp. RC10]|uniref:hypothetical protein n=1 Tax=Pseudomonas bambusae TaxID=3139142 RepID=UPI00313910F8
MNPSTGIPGGTENAVDSIEPLEPGRPDVIPNPPPGSDDVGEGEGEIPLKPDDEAPLEEDMSDVEANDAVSAEHPPLR